MNLGEVKDFHLVRREVVCASKDSAPLFHSTWNSIGVAKLGVGITVSVGIILNLNVIPSAKCRAVESVVEDGESR